MILVRHISYNLILILLRIEHKWYYKEAVCYSVNGNEIYNFRLDNIRTLKTCKKIK